MKPLHIPARRAPRPAPGAALILMAASAALGSTARAQVIDFAQLEASRDTRNVVLVGTLPGASQPATLVSASATRWATGEALGVGVVPRWSLAAGDPGWTVGLGLGANHWRSRDAANPRRESGLSLRAQSEWLGALPGGRYYALLQASSFRNSGFATVQLSLAALPLALELSHYAETGYRASTAAVRWQLGGSKWSLRAGATRSIGHTQGLVGVGYNGF